MFNTITAYPAPVDNGFKQYHRQKQKKMLKEFVCGLYAPLNSGLILKMEIHPALANCPNVVSRYTSGIPHMKSVKK